MPIKFDIYPSPVNAENKGTTTYHARVTNSETITTDEIAQNIHKRCTLTTSDIKAVLVGLHDEIVNHLCNGDHVHLEGLGYFKIILSAPKGITPDKKRHPRIGIKAVDFRADSLLKKTLQEKAKFVRSSSKRQSASLDIYEVDALLNDPSGTARTDGSGKDYFVVRGGFGQKMKSFFKKLLMSCEINRCKGKN